MACNIPFRIKPGHVLVPVEDEKRVYTVKYAPTAYTYNTCQNCGESCEEGNWCDGCEDEVSVDQEHIVEIVAKDINTTYDSYLAFSDRDYDGHIYTNFDEKYKVYRRTNEADPKCTNYVELET